MRVNTNFASVVMVVVVVMEVERGWGCLEGVELGPSKEKRLDWDVHVDTECLHTIHNTRIRS